MKVIQLFLLVMFKGYVLSQTLIFFRQRKPLILKFDHSSGSCPGSATRICMLETQEGCYEGEVVRRAKTYATRHWKKAGKNGPDH